MTLSCTGPATFYEHGDGESMMSTIVSACWRWSFSIILLGLMLNLAWTAPWAAPPVSETKTPSLFAPTPKVSTTKPEDSANGETTASGGSTGKADEDSRPLVNRLDVTPEPGEELEEAYFRYFQEFRVAPKVLRAKVRRLISDTENKKRFEEVVALLRAALRSGQVQPWMYEALGLSMEMSNMPRDEVERTLMSAVDFTTDARHLLYIADYMQHFKFNERALQLLKEVTNRNPDLADAYIRGLELAIELKDDDGIRWASLGILGKAWPAEQRAIRDKARRSALALLARMRKDGQKEKADALALKLKNALVRDVVVRITWPGDADVDLMIEEPGGSVCSYRCPRTSNGGVLIGDPTTKLDRSSGAGYSEVYVCPQGFSGTYRAMLRQVWGRIPTGKVTVDVWTHGGTEKQFYRHQSVPLNDDGVALVAFDLKDGRRTDSLKRHQLTQDVLGQVAVNRAILAQQINAIANARAVRAQQIANQQQQPFVIGQTPVVDGQGGVGFRPEVIVLPIGATMSVNAVISADRRYVRITALPFFSNIVGVTQFNLSQGVTGIDTDLGGLDVDIGAGAADVDLGDVDAGNP
jgi:hypothetical protein